MGWIIKVDQINSDVYLSVSDSPHLFSAIKLNYNFFGR